jgi:NitT/TauT family transport system permease protein
MNSNLSPNQERPLDIATTPRHQPPRESWVSRKRAQILPLGTAVMILVLWEVLGRTMNWNPLFFSYPSKIWGGFIDLASGPLLGDLRVSGTEFALGMGLSILIAVPVGLAMGSLRNLYYAMDPLVTALYSTPVLVLAPMLVIWFGLGISSKVAIVVILSTFPMMINLTEGVRNTDRALLRAARSFGASRWRIYRDVLFPAVVPFFVTGLRLAIGRAMIGVVVGEYIASTSGIGYQINSDAEVFATSRYLAGVAVILVFSVATMEVLKVLERRLAPWGHASRAQE